MRVSARQQGVGDIAVDQGCEYLEKCPMFRYFGAVAKYVYQRIYCQGNPGICARRKLRLEGKPVPENLMPQGTKMWPDNEDPPPGFRLPGA